MQQKSDIDYCLICEIETSTAKLHDSQVDLSTEGEVVLRDIGYFGERAKGNDFTMKRRTTEKPLGNSTKNAIVDQHFGIAGRNTTCYDKTGFWSQKSVSYYSPKVHIEGLCKNMITTFALNLYQLCTLKNAGII